MNKSTFLVLILLFSMIAISTSVQATGPVCNHEGNKTVCIDTRAQAYNSSKPLIKIDFYETPVNIKDIYLLNDQTSSKVNLFEKSNTDQKQYEYTPENYLGDYPYTLVLDALDLDQNEIQMYVNFTVNTSAMKVWVKKPENKYVKNPEFAFGNSTSFFFEIQTERPGECGYSVTNFNSSNSEDHEFTNAPKFKKNTTNKTLSYLTNFSLNKLIGKYVEGQDRILYLICKENSTEAKYSEKEIIIGQDTTAPNIAMTENPETVINSNDRSSTINITTGNDLSVCTIQNTNRPENGTAILSKVPPGTRFNAFENFTRQYSENLTIPPANPSKYDYLLNVSCDNIANYHSSKIFHLKADIIQVQDMTVIYPRSVINTTNFDLNVSTVIRNDVCEYSFNKTGHDFKPLNFANTLNSGESLFTAKATGVEGRQTVYVNCSLRGGFKEHTFTIDTTGPTAPEISARDNTCSLTSFNAQFKSNDTNGTGVSRYYYNITYDTKTNDTTSITGHSSGSLLKTMAFAKESGDLTIKVYAIDNAGNKGASSTKTIKITNDSIDECDFTKPKITINQSQDNETKEWTISVSCKDNQSGCKNTFDYSVQDNTSCVYDQSANLEDPVTITNSSIFCAVVYDNNDNNKTYTDSYKVDFPIHCKNKVKDLSETDVDCGGDCGASCDINSTCITNKDCLDKYCAPSRTCQIPSCSDRIKNGEETSVDCGGSSCSSCAVGKSCLQDNDCTTGNCFNESCANASCTDGKVDGTETDVDCGGDCGASCENDYICSMDSDCVSGYCADSGKCDINPTLDSDSDGLPDVWERDNFNCITCANPDDDPDGDGYTNLEEFKAGTDPNDASSIPSYHKIKIITIILLVLGGLAIIAGAYLLFTERSKKKKVAQRTQQEQYKNIFSDTPKPIIKQKEKTTTQRPLTKKEIELGRQRRALSLKEREEKRRQLFNEFSTQNTTRPPVQTQPSPVVSKPKPPKPKVEKEKTEEYIDISKLKQNKLTDKKKID